MAHYYLIGGHGNGDPGACAHGYQEWDLARQFNALLGKYLKQLGQKVTIYNGTGNVNTTKDMFQQTAKNKGLWVFTPDNRIIVENHLNSIKGDVHGTETLIGFGLSADQYDKSMNKALANFFTNRGIKKRPDLLNINVAKLRGLNYRLNELCFISNKNDVQKLVKNMDKIAREMAETLTGKKINQPAPAKSIGIGTFMGQSGVEVYAELFEWDIIIGYLNGLDYYNYEVKVNTGGVRNIYSAKTGKKVGEFKPSSTPRHMHLSNATMKKLQNRITKD